jgi:hypothetical protein
MAILLCAGHTGKVKEWEKTGDDGIASPVGLEDRRAV